MKCVSGMLLPEFNHCLLSDKECEKDKCPQWQSFTQFDRIKNFNVEEMAEFMRATIEDCEKYCAFTKNGKCNSFGFEDKCAVGIKQWLESEVTK